MAMAPFLAMTAAEISGNPLLPEKLAWMACHFSPYGPGLSNLPRRLPPGSLLVLDDITPIRRHDPRIIREQLCVCAGQLQCCGILLDFQRPVQEETAALVNVLAEGLPCPLAVSEIYAGVCGCAVCLPPVPPSVLPEAYFSRWQGRELWLEVGTEAQVFTVTERGASVTGLPFPQPPEPHFFDESLLCHYHREIRESEILFTLFRTPEDRQRLLDRAEAYGVTRSVGLYQELCGPQPFL